MMAAPLLVCVVVFLLFPMLVVPQTCEPLTRDSCSQIIAVGTPIFVPAGYTLSFLESFTVKLANQANFIGVGEPCRSYFLQGMCGSFLRPCLLGAAVPIPHQPCLDICWSGYNSCAPGQIAAGFPPGLSLFYPPGYSPPLNCSAPMIDTGAYNMSFYSQPVQTVTVGSTNYSVPCSQNVTVAVPLPIICHSPLVPVDTPASYSTGALPPQRCAFTCPLPALSDSEYDSAKIMQGIVGWLSWVTTALMIIFLGLFPKGRDFPRNLVLMSAFAAHIAAAAIIVPTFAGYQNTWCGDSEQAVIPQVAVNAVDEYSVPIISFTVSADDLSFESSLCTFQGAMLQFGFLAAVIWWAIIAFNMCLELFFLKSLSLNSPRWKWSRFLVYNMVAWGVAFLCMVIPASAGRIKFAPAATYCFVTDEDNFAWSATFWFIPVGFSMVAGVSLFGLALVRLTILFFALKKIKKLLLLYARLLVFVFLYLVLFVFIFAYNIQYASNKGEIEQGYMDYYTCIVYDVADCQLSGTVSNYHFVMLKGWAISVLGVLLFCLFISTGDVFEFWFRFCLSLGQLLLRKKAMTYKKLLNMFVTASWLVQTPSDSVTLAISVSSVAEGRIVANEDEEDEGGEQPSGSSSSD